MEKSRALRLMLGLYVVAVLCGVVSAWLVVDVVYYPENNNIDTADTKLKIAVPLQLFFLLLLYINTRLQKKIKN